MFLSPAHRFDVLLLQEQNPARDTYLLVGVDNVIHEGISMILNDNIVMVSLLNRYSTRRCLGPA